jgi:diguanylate cyclase (GGDEF)-like protein
MISEVFIAQEGDRPFQELAAAAQRLVHMDKERLGELLRDVGNMIPEAEGVFETQFLVRTSTDNILDDAREALMLRNLRALQEVDYLQDHAESLASSTKELEETTRRDALTGLFNRGYLDRFLEFAFKESSERDEPLSIVFADLDKFKGVNDTYGHQIGDQILVATANILKSGVRASDIVARYGGEECVLVLPNTPVDLLQTICNRIVGTFRSTRHDVGADAPLAVTISMGLATHGDKGTFNSVDEFVRAADKALYTAKIDGRDRAVPFHQIAGRTIKKMA